MAGVERSGGEVFWRLVAIVFVAAMLSAFVNYGLHQVWAQPLWLDSVVTFLFIFAALMLWVRRKPGTNAF
jgi:uncharacterized membrane protein YfcA